MRLFRDILVLTFALVSCAHEPGRTAVAPTIPRTEPAESLMVEPAPARPEQIATDKPLLLNVVPGRLQVSFTQTQIETPAGKVAVWHWISSGLKALYQKEVAITLRAESVNVLPDRMQWVVGYYAALFGYAERGRLVDSGSLTALSTVGALGRQDFAGMLYIDSDGSGNLEIPADTLSALFLTAEEYSVATDMGPSRLLGFWAVADHYFPYPFWTDVTHQSRVTPRQVSTSILNHMQRAMLPEISISLEDKTHLVLRVPKNIRPQLKQIEDVPLTEPFAFLTGIDGDADSILVWVPDSKEITVIGPNAEEQKRVSGAFFGIATKETQWQAGPAEDGYVVMMSQDSWKALRHALVEGKPFSVQLGEGLPELSLEWID